MASTSRSPAPEALDTSYIEMDRDSDATLIGKHCQLDYCNQLDFLPFHCQSCKKTFCLDHRTEDAHKCANKGSWAERKRQAALAKPSAGEGKRMRDFVTEKPCDDDHCKTVIGKGLVTGVHCDQCNRDYCLKHRLREDHDCKSKVPIGARQRDLEFAKQKTQNTFARLRSIWAAKKESASKIGKSSATLAANQAMRELKKEAKGDPKTPDEKKVYLHVEAEAETTTANIPSMKLFYNKDWVVGRMLDDAARRLQIQNINNQSSDEKNKLRVFHVESGDLLPFNEKIGARLGNGNTVVLLRGVGPPANLIEL